MQSYFGTYQTFNTFSKKEAAVLMGPNCLIGDTYSLTFTITDGKHRVIISNRFGEDIGYFNSDFSRQLSLLRADGLHLTASLCFVAFSEEPEPGEYWGQMAVFAYNPAFEDSFLSFINSIQKLLAEGIRPQISLQQEAIQKLIETNGEWIPQGREPLPQKEKGVALLKTKQSITDRLIIKGRDGNKGCYIISWVLILTVVALVIFCFNILGVF